MSADTLPHMTQPSDCEAWLASERLAYDQEPCSAWERMVPTLRLFGQAAMAGPSDFGCRLALHLSDLLGELWRSEQIETVLDTALPWLDAGFGADVATALLALRCRMHLRFGRLAPALALLDRLSRSLPATAPALERAHLTRALGACLMAQARPAAALEAYREALALYKVSPQAGRWVEIYAAISVVHRQLQQRSTEQAVLREGLDAAVAERRWISACNVGASLAEELIRDGQLEQALPLLEAAQTYLDRSGSGAERIAKELLAARAALAAHQGRMPAAIELMERVVADSRRFSMRRQIVHRLKQLARWQVEGGQGLAGLASLEEAHALQLDDLQEGNRRDRSDALRRIELLHAQQLKERAEAHAGELATKAQALQEALDLQREMQAELIERSKLATLGHLLAGVAHELNTPLGSALTGLSTVADVNAALQHSLSGAALSRRRVKADLSLCQDGTELARRNVEQALALVQSYQHLSPDPTPESHRPVPLGPLIEAAWRRAVSPGTALQLRCDSPLTLSLPAEALTEVLLQLFQNVERHAYPAGHAGLVEVRARHAQGQLHLTVADQGSGIAPALLPRVLDPYVSTQFGRGRSGLGLFVAQVTVLQRLRGRIRMGPNEGGGCRVEIECPAELLSPARAADVAAPPRG